MFEQIQAGNAAAFEELYTRHSALVYSFALRACHDVTVASEITQDVFIRLWTTKAQYREELSQFPTWLLTIARRIHQDKLKSRSRTVNVITLFNQLEDKNHFYESELGVTQKWFRQDVDEALSALSTEDRTVIELAYFQGFTLSEIATELQQPLGTIKTRLHRGLKYLRQRLTDWKGGLER